MSINTFEDLHRAVCEVLGQAAETLAVDELGSKFEITVDGQHVVVLHSPGRAADCALVLMNLAAAPARSEQATLSRLMDANLAWMTLEGSPTCSRNTVTGEQFVQLALPFAGIGANEFLTRVVRLADMAAGRLIDQ